MRPSLPDTHFPLMVGQHNSSAEQASAINQPPEALRDTSGWLEPFGWYAEMRENTPAESSVSGSYSPLPHSCSARSMVLDLFVLFDQCITIRTLPALWIPVNVIGL